MRDKGCPLSGPILQEKAKSLNLLMGGDPNFSASIGWFDRWKKRHGIRQIGICREKLSADPAEVKRFQEKFFKIVEEEELTPDQIYNCDETGLNYKMLPKRTLAPSTEKQAPGGLRPQNKELPFWLQPMHQVRISFR